MAKLLKGIGVVRAMSAGLKSEAERLKGKGIRPCLCVMRAGSREDDIAYENGILKRCGDFGIEVRSVVLDENAATSDVVAEIEKANVNSGIHGVLIMRPMPRQIDDGAVCAALDPQKDMDGITETSMARLYAGHDDAFTPCTAQACIELLDYYGIEISGMNITVIGRSLVIGRPVSLMLIKRNATVTVCHTKTADLHGECRRADIVIAAAGVAGMIDADYITDGQTVIDVGINVDAEGNLCGDVDFGSAETKAGAITPVPGGVGTVTSAVLAKHVILAASRTEK